MQASQQDASCSPRRANRASIATSACSICRSRTRTSITTCDLSALICEWTQLYAATEDVHDAARFEREVEAENRVHTRGIEVGQVFYFGTKYSDPMKASVTGPDGVERPVHGGSYGIGVSRLVGAIIEASHDDAGIVWPESVAPFKVGLVNLKAGDAASDGACEALYAKLGAAGVGGAL